MWKKWKLTSLTFFGSKITVDGEYSHKIKRHLFLGRKAITNLDSVWKSTDITLPTNDHIAKAMVFPVVMYRCESWTIKKAERQRIDAFKLWCWRRLLIVPWTERRSNQSIQRKSTLNSHWNDWCWSWSSYFGHLMERAKSLEKTLVLGKSEGKRRRRQQRFRWLDSITNSIDMNLSKRRETVKDRGT